MYRGLGSFAVDIQGDGKEWTTWIGQQMKYESSFLFLTLIFIWHKV